MIEKILLADSGMGNTETMMKVLMDIPLIQRAAVTVLHVVPSQVSAEAMASKWEEGGRTLATAINTLDLDPSKVNAVLREGDPKDVGGAGSRRNRSGPDHHGLPRAAGAEGHSRKFRLASMSFSCPSRPMLLVKDDLYTIRPLKRIMVAMDKSDSAKEGLNIAISLLRDIKGGELTLVSHGQ